MNDAQNIEYIKLTNLYKYKTYNIITNKFHS